MAIRVLLRLMPLICVAIFTLTVFVLDHPADRAQEIRRGETRRLAWESGLVKCPDPRGNLPIAACLAGNSPRNPPAPH